MTFKEQLRLRIDLAVAGVLAKVDTKLAAFLIEVNKIPLLHKAAQYLYDRVVALRTSVTTLQNITNQHDARLGALEESMIGSAMTTLKGELFVNTVASLELPLQSTPYIAADVVAVLHSKNNSTAEIGTYLFTISDGVLLLDINGISTTVDESDIIVIKYNNDGNGNPVLDTIKVTKRELFGIGDIGAVTVGDLATANPNFSQELSAPFLIALA